MPVIVTTLVALGVHAAALLVRRKRVAAEATAEGSPAEPRVAEAEPPDGERERRAA